jgi:hypothetical protein
MKKKLRLIAVDEQNYNALKLLGHVPESFNDIVTKLLQSGSQVRGLNQTVAQKVVAASTSSTTQQKKELIPTNG